MKIKDVIQKTDLTDRAIRLYIENDLVSPSYNESYAGRKNIEFSEEDVEKLKNIATLRKAGFSIAEIKVLAENSENSKNTLESFIEKTNQRIENDTEVVSLLYPLLNESEISIDKICRKLNKVTTDKAVPEEDIEPSLLEKIERVFFLVFAGAGLLYATLTVVLTVWNIFLQKPFIFPTPTEYFWSLFTSVLIISAISIHFIHCYKKHKRRKHPAIQRLCSGILVTLLCVVFYFGSIIAFFSFNIVSLTFSLTENPLNYLVLDKNFDVSLFPASVPSFAYDKNGYFLNSTKYHYDYYYDADIFDLDIIAEWSYPKTDYYINQFRNEVEYYKQIKNEYTGKLPEKVKKGNWICLNYCKTDESDWSHGYTFKIFAYNEETLTVRYIYSSGEGPCGSAFEPDHFSLNW